MGEVTLGAWVSMRKGHRGLEFWDRAGFDGQEAQSAQAGHGKKPLASKQKASKGGHFSAHEDALRKGTAIFCPEAVSSGVGGLAECPTKARSIKGAISLFRQRLGSCRLCTSGKGIFRQGLTRAQKLSRVGVMLDRPRFLTETPPSLGNPSTFSFIPICPKKGGCLGNELCRDPCTPCGFVLLLGDPKMVVFLLVSFEATSTNGHPHMYVPSK